MVDLFTREPRETSRVSPRAVPVSDPNQPFVGLRELQRSLSGFFGSLEDASTQIGAATATREKAEIIRENEREQNQAAADALAGKAPDPGLSNDDDYTITYRRVLGASMGSKAAEEYALNAYPSLQNGEDFDAHANTFLQEQFQNGSSFGRPDDPAFQTEFLSAFQKGTSPLKTAHRNATIKATVQQGFANHRAELASTFSTDFSLDFLERHAERRRALSGGFMTPGEAMQAVVGDLIGMARESPAKLAKIERLIAEGGFGERFPDATVDMLDRITQAQTGIHSKRVADLYHQHELAIISAPDAGTLADVISDIRMTASMWGGSDRANGLVEQAFRRVDTLGVGEAKYNAFKVALAEGRSTPGDASNFLLRYLTEANALPWEAADATTQARAAEILGAAGSAGAEVQAMIRTALSGRGGREMLENTSRTLAAVERLMGHDYVATRVIPEDQRAAWTFIQDQMVPGQDFGKIAERLSNLGDDNATLKMNFLELGVVADTVKEANDFVRETALSALKEQANPDATSVDISPEAWNFLERSLKRAMRFRTTEDGAEALIQRTIADASYGLAISLEEGGNRLVFHTKRAPEGKLNFGRNVARDGTVTNTVDKFRADAQVISRVLGLAVSRAGDFHIPGLRGDTLGADMTTRYASAGMAMLTHNGAALVLPAKVLGLPERTTSELLDPANLQDYTANIREFNLGSLMSDEPPPNIADVTRPLWMHPDVKLYGRNPADRRPPTPVAEKASAMLRGEAPIDMIQLQPLEGNPNMYLLLYRPNTVDNPTIPELEARRAREITSSQTPERF